MEFASVLTNNIAAIVMAAIFLWYLNKRDARFEDMIKKLTDVIDDLREEIIHKI